MNKILAKFKYQLITRATPLHMATFSPVNNSPVK